ncbi:MAG: hypothetical protein JSV04_10855 [Candidatus Heimdallarchaeota archaeon]|nr:MAG: hypothetical protein JSV04_10855 [Candidatus Heimdallarchaeota archaeon]
MNTRNIVLKKDYSSILCFSSSTTTSLHLTTTSKTESDTSSTGVPEVSPTFEFPVLITFFLFFSIHILRKKKMKQR